MPRSRALLFLLLLALASLASRGCAAPGRRPEAGRWWRGNTHTHTLWSDGDGAPLLVVDEYRRRGYAFLVLSDHNVLSEGPRWFPVGEGGRLTPARVEELGERFGPQAVRVRAAEGGGRELRLSTLAEVRARFEEPGRFLMLQGEEITDRFEGKPLHVNGLNLAELVEPQGGTSVTDVLSRDLEAVAAQGRRLGRPTLAHVNHPNFGWAVTWEDLAHVAAERFFEVYNGHRSVHNRGDAERPGLEEMWDRANTLRRTALDLPLLYGLATDDAHHYHADSARTATIGRGWIQVRAERLAPDELLAAMRRGDFYASSGVVLDDVDTDGERYRVDIAVEPGVTYTTRFIGTRRTASGVGPVGEVLAETTADPAVYAFHGDELFVRAVVLSSRPHPDPNAAGDLETAWTQPAAPR